MPPTCLEPTQNVPGHEPSTNTIRPTLAIKQKVRREYIEGKDSLPTLCNKHRISFDTAKDWACREKWSHLRQVREERALAALQANPGAGLAGLGSGDGQPQASTNLTTLEAHLKRIDDAIESCDNAKDLAQLTRARSDIVEALWLEKTGSKPGTAKPKSSRRPSQAYATPLPDQSSQEPLVSPATPPVAGYTGPETG